MLLPNMRRVLLMVLLIALMPRTSFAPVKVEAWFYRLQCPFKDNYVPRQPEHVFVGWRQALKTWR
jgi:hypothetical protein